MTFACFLPASSFDCYPNCFDQLHSTALLFFPHTALFLLYVLIDTVILSSTQFLASKFHYQEVAFFVLFHMAPLDLNALRFPQVLCSPSFPFHLKLGNFVPPVHYISASKFFFSSKLGLDSECHMLLKTLRRHTVKGMLLFVGRKKKRLYKYA